MSGHATRTMARVKRIERAFAAFSDDPRMVALSKELIPFLHELALNVITSDLGASEVHDSWLTSGRNMLANDGDLSITHGVPAGPAPPPPPPEEVDSYRERISYHRQRLAAQPQPRGPQPRGPPPPAQARQSGRLQTHERFGDDSDEEQDLNTQLSRMSASQPDGTQSAVRVAQGKYDHRLGDRRLGNS